MITVPIYTQRKIMTSLPGHRFTVLLAIFLLTISALGQTPQSSPVQGDLPAAPEQAAPTPPPFLVHGPLHHAAHDTAADLTEDHTQPLDCSAPADSLSDAYRVSVKLTAAQQRDLHRYFFLLTHKIRDNWSKSIPLAGQTGPFQKKGDVGIQFTILANGALAKAAGAPVMTVSSGRASFDKHAMDSLVASAPFLPLPDGVPEKMEVCLFFLYDLPRQQKKPIDLWPPPPHPTDQSAQH